MGWLIGWLVGLCFAAPEPLAWSELGEVAEAAWARGPGAAYRAERAGLVRAEGATPWTELGLSGRLAPALGRNLDTWDDNNELSITFTVGDRRARRIAWWRAQVALGAASAEVERLAFADAVRAAWLETWVVRSLATHLEEHLGTLQAQLDAVEPAVVAGILSPEVAEDLRVERSRLEAEAALYAQEAEVGTVRLSALLGAMVQVDEASLPPLADLPTGGENPWRSLRDRVDEMPGIRQAEAHAAVDEAEARWARAHPPVTVDLGGIYRPAPGRWGTVGPVIGVSIPLSNPDRAQAHHAEGRALAHRIRRDFARAQLTASHTAEARALDAARSREQRLLRAVERPLRERLERLSEALVRGEGSVEGVIRARRDLHEVFDERARTTAEVFIRRARGQALLDFLGEPPAAQTAPP